ncbi:MAG: LysR family transcriptional regulator [Rhizobiaceae bacterium]
MHNINALKAFVEVSRFGSFTAAARQLGLSTSSVSRLILDLEAWLQTPLLRRTTRSLTLTDAGEHYLAHCTSIVSAWNFLDNEGSANVKTPRGKLHVAGAAVPMRKRITPLLPGFLEQFPEVQIELHLEDRPVDLIADGIDVALRIGRLEDSALIARKCGEVQFRLTASPAFLEKFGVPRSLDEVSAMPCLCDLTPRSGRRWPIGRRVPVEGPVAANDGDITREMTLAGLGLSLLPDFFVENDIEEGRLISLFPDQITDKAGIYILLPVRKQITPTARAFTDFLIENLSQA